MPGVRSISTCGWSKRLQAILTAVGTAPIPEGPGHDRADE